MYIFVTKISRIFSRNISRTSSRNISRTFHAWFLKCRLCRTRLGNLGAARPPPDRRPTAARPPPDRRPTAARPPPDRRPTAARPPPDRRPTAARPPPDCCPSAARPPPQDARWGRGGRNIPRGDPGQLGVLGGNGLFYPQLSPSRRHWAHSTPAMPY